MNAGLSVSRVGGNAQIKAMKAVAGGLRLDLAQYRELAAFAQFGSDLDKVTQFKLARGQRMLEVLKQNQYEPMPVQLQVAIIFAGNSGMVDKIPVDLVRTYEKEMLAWMDRIHPEFLREIAEKKTIEKDKTDKDGKVVEKKLEGKMKEALAAFGKEFSANHGLS